MAARAQPGAGRREQAPFQRLVRQLGWQRPADPGGGGPRQVILHGATADADLAGDHPSAGAGTEVSSRTCRIRRMDSLSVGIRVPSIDCDGETWTPVERLTRETISSSRKPSFCLAEGGRDQIGMVAAIKSEPRPRSGRNAWPPYVGIRTGAHRSARRNCKRGRGRGLLSLRNASGGCQYRPSSPVHEGLIAEITRLVRARRRTIPSIPLPSSRFPRATRRLGSGGVTRARGRRVYDPPVGSCGSAASSINAACA